MGKKVLVAVAFLFALVAVVYLKSPYMEAGRTAKADYESCQRACSDAFTRCMNRCDGYPSSEVEKCQNDCRYEKQRCNCQ